PKEPWMRRLPLCLVLLTSAAARTAAAAAAPPPEVTPAFFAAHREAFLAKLPKDAVVVLHAAPESNTEVGELYRQGSAFWYLTGLSEPESVALFRPGAPEGKRYVLFVRPRDFAQEQWTGWRVGVDGAKAELGADEAYPVAEFTDRFRELTLGAKA